LNHRQIYPPERNAQSFPFSQTESKLSSSNPNVMPTYSSFRSPRIRSMGHSGPRGRLARLASLCFMLAWCGGAAACQSAATTEESGGAGAESRAADPGERFSDARCEADYERYAEARDLSRLSQKGKSLAGTTASYAAAGTLAITETLLYTTGGIALGALVCSPIIAIEAASDTGGSASVECVVRIGSYAMIALAQESEYSMTQGVWRATEGLRLESYDDLAAFLLDSAECRIERNGPGDRDLAGRQLRALRGETGIWPHLSVFSVERAQRLERLAARP
jgi:hypothetical protein